MQQSNPTALQRRLAIALACVCIAYLAYLLTTSMPPELGDWAGPPHLSSSVLLAVILSAVLAPHHSSNVSLGWWTLTASALFIVGFECAQLLTPGRSFQFMDIALGIAGAAIAMLIAMLISHVIGRYAYTWLAIGLTGVVLVASALLLSTDTPIGSYKCEAASIDHADWELVRIDNFKADASDDTRVTSSIGAFCVFDAEEDSRNPEPAPVASAITANQKLNLSGAGLISAHLNGFREAAASSGQFTFGIRFKAAKLQAERPPRLLALLQTTDRRSSILRVFQNGPNANIAVGFQPWQRSSTLITNRLRDQYHELVLTYDGTVQTTYFDGEVIGTEVTSMAPIDVTGDEYVLNIGRRVDLRWQAFHGEIDAIAIGTTSLSAADVAILFESS